MQEPYTSTYFGDLHFLVTWVDHLVTQISVTRRGAAADANSGVCCHLSILYTLHAYSVMSGLRSLAFAANVYL
jgi:hypothetical protein